MNALNSILVEGNVSRDPVIRKTPKGTTVCEFTIASNRYTKSNTSIEKEVSFFSIEVWGRLAESCSEYCKKGRGVRIVGRLRQSRWAGEDGKEHSKVVIVAGHIEWRPNFKKEA